MNTLKFYHVVSVFLLLMVMISPVSAESSEHHYGFIESIGISADDKEDLKELQVSGRKYKFDWAKVSVIYKSVYVSASDLRKGMKIKFQTSSPDSDRIVSITILTQDDSLINH